MSDAEKMLKWVIFQVSSGKTQQTSSIFYCIYCILLQIHTVNIRIHKEFVITIITTWSNIVAWHRSFSTGWGQFTNFSFTGLMYSAFTRFFSLSLTISSSVICLTKFLHIQLKNTFKELAFLLSNPAIFLSQSILKMLFLDSQGYIW